MHGCVKDVSVTCDVSRSYDATASFGLHFLRQFALAAHQKGGLFESNLCEIRFQLVRGHNLKFRLRCIVALESPGDARRVFTGVKHFKTELFGEHGGGHGAVTQDGWPFRGEVHNGRLHADFTFTAVEDHIEFAFGFDTQIIGHVLGVGRRKAADGHSVLTAGDGVVDTIAFLED